MKSKTKYILLSAVLAVLVGVMVFTQGLYSADSKLADNLYQKPTALGGDIVLINIDQTALDQMGPFADWGRKTMGEAIAKLNEDPENAPAVIGIDVLYVGESDDPEGDAYLAEQAGKGCPVVVAEAATFSSQLQIDEESDEFYMEEDSIVAFDAPYDALYDNTWQGHINTMYDADGVLRHAIWSLDVEGYDIPSLARQVYEIYMGDTADYVVPECNEKGAYYVPYQAKPGDFSDGYSVYDLLNGDIPSDVFAGKIVLIGPYAAGMQDEFVTGMDHAQKMYGIEYQANQIQALINGVTKKEAPVAPQAIIAAIIAFLSMLYFRQRKVKFAVLGWAVILAVYLGICIVMYKSMGIVVSPLYIPLAVTCIFIGTVAYNYVQAALEKRKVTNTFQRYVAPEIVSELLREGSDAIKLGGNNVDIAVLFVDIRGFTSMSEVLTPEQVVEILNRYLTLTSSCIFKNGGTLDKFVGDCTMAFWGAPLPCEDSIYKAVKTAFDMVEGAAVLKEELMERFGRSVDFGIGVHYGPAVVGNIGAPNRMDYTAIGDTVNTSSRLESNAPKGTIYVSRIVADALEGRVEFESLGDSVPLKGKAAGFEVLKAIKLVERENG